MVVNGVDRNGYGYGRYAGDYRSGGGYGGSQYGGYGLGASYSYGYDERYASYYSEDDEQRKKPKSEKVRQKPMPPSSTA